MTDEQREARIVVTPNVVHGKPRLAGTRIMVYLILDLLDAGVSAEQIASEDYYPDLTLEDIQACIAYGRKRAKVRVRAPKNPT